MRLRSEHDAVPPMVRQWLVRHPSNRTELRTPQPVRIDYPNGMAVELVARVVGKRPRPGLPTAAEG